MIVRYMKIPLQPGFVALTHLKIELFPPNKGGAGGCPGWDKTVLSDRDTPPAGDSFTFSWPVALPSGMGNS